MEKQAPRRSMSVIMVNRDVTIPFRSNFRMVTRLPAISLERIQAAEIFSFIRITAKAVTVAVVAEVVVQEAALVVGPAAAVVVAEAVAVRVEVVAAAAVALAAAQAELSAQARPVTG